MASQDNLLTRILAIVRGLDDASWEALASKGLLRRARKELDSGLKVEIVGETDSEIAIAVPPFQVSMPLAGPAKAQCNCPAPGICQHIIAAGLYLQSIESAADNQVPSATPESIAAELKLIPLEALRTWAGSADFRAGVALFEKNSLPSRIEYSESVLIRLMPSAIEARFVPGGGLDGMIVPQANPKRVAVAAMLALRKSLGLELPKPDQQQSLIEFTGAPRTNAELLASAQSVLEDAVNVGLSHLSPSVAERFLTLAVSAQGANLPRISLALKALSDEVQSLCKREAQADEARLFLSMARIYALSDSIRRSGDLSDAALIGTSRLQYVEVPEMEVAGLGAYTWKTRSGYAGLTLLFWSNITHEFLSWSEARPVGQQFDPRQRFFGEGPWDGTQSARQAASSSLRLRNARRTAGGRISGSAKTSALVLSPTAPQNLAVGDRLFTSWLELRNYSLRLQPLGLRDSSPLDRVVLLEPAFFGEKSFDSVTQTFTWEVYDESGQRFVLSLPFEDCSKETIHKLEGLTPTAESRWKILAILAAGDQAQPVSILCPGDSTSPIFHLAFDAIPKQSPAKRPPAAEEQVEDMNSAPDETAEIDLQPDSGRLVKVLAEFEQRLVSIAETGTTGGGQEDQLWFSQSKVDLRHRGLTALGAIAAKLARPSSNFAADLLKARYLLYIHGQASARVG